MNEYFICDFKSNRGCSVLSNTMYRAICKFMYLTYNEKSKTLEKARHIQHEDCNGLPHTPADHNYFLIPFSVYVETRIAKIMSVGNIAHN